MTDAGLDAVWAQCPDASDAGPAYELDGGAWVLPPPRGPRLACRLAGCEGYARGLEPQPPPPSTLVLAVIMLAVGLLLGAYSGFELSRFWR